MIKAMKKSLVGMGIFFALSSITCFLAYNWSKMSSLQKIGIPVFLFILSIGTYFLTDKKKNIQEIALFCGSFFIGSTFAMYGQVYQTGANPYNLFFLWAILMGIFTFVGRNYFLLALQSVVIGLGIFFWITTYVSIFYGIFGTGIFFLLELIIYLYFAKKGRYERNSYFYGFLSTMIFIVTFLSLIDTNLDMRNINRANIYPGIFLIVVYLTGRYFSRPSLEMIAVALLPSLIIRTLISNALRYNIEGDAIKIIIGLGIIVYLIALGVLSKIKRYKDSVVFIWIRRFLLIFIYALLLLFCYILTNDDRLIFIITLTLSQLIPFMLKWKKDKTEPINFLVACTAISMHTYNLMREFKLFVFFNIIYFFRRTRALDLFYVPVHYYIIKEFFGGHNSQGYLVTRGCIGIFICLFFLVYIFKGKDWRPGIVAGAKLTAAYHFTSSTIGYFLYRNRFLTYTKKAVGINNINYITYIETILFIILIICVLKEVLWEIKKRKFYMLSIGVILLSCLMIGDSALLLGLFIFLDSIRQKENRILTFISIGYLIAQVVLYCYLLQLPLLKISIRFGETAIAFLLTAISLWKEEDYEENISIDK